MIFKFLHFGFSVPRFPGTWEVVEAEGGQRGTGWAGRPCCL